MPATYNDIELFYFFVVSAKIENVTSAKSNQRIIVLLPQDERLKNSAAKVYIIYHFTGILLLDVAGTCDFVLIIKRYYSISL